MNKPTYEELQAQVKQLAAERDAVAAENSELKAAFAPKEIPTGATDVFSDTAILKIDGDEFHSSQWVDNEADVIRAVLEAIKPETPATDAILASLRAEGVEMFGDHLRKKGSNPIVCKMIALGADEFAAQLRSKSEVQS